MTTTWTLEFEQRKRERDRSAFGQLVKKLRLARGMGLSRFAEKIGWRPSRLAGFEHGRGGGPVDMIELDTIHESLGLEERAEHWAFLTAASASGPYRKDTG